MHSHHPRTKDGLGSRNDSLIKRLLTLSDRFLTPSLLILTPSLSVVQETQQHYVPELTPGELDTVKVIAYTLILALI